MFLLNYLGSETEKVLLIIKVYSICKDHLSKASEASFFMRNFIYLTSLRYLC